MMHVAPAQDWIYQTSSFSIHWIIQVCIYPQGSRVSRPHSPTDLQILYLSSTANPYWIEKPNSSSRPCWWLNHPFENMLVKLDHFPKDQGEKRQIFEIYHESPAGCWTLRCSRPLFFSLVARSWMVFCCEMPRPLTAVIYIRGVYNTHANEQI